MTTLLLFTVAAGCVALAVQLLVHLDRASGTPRVSGGPATARLFRGSGRAGDQASPALFVLSAVLVLLVVAALL
jgi:hypothetical protein